MTTATFRTISCPASLWNWNGITSRHPPVNRLGFLRRLPVVRIQHKNHSSKSSGEQKWVTKGLITESLPNGMFSVRLENGDVVIGYTSGKMRCNKIRMMPGDKVEIEVSRYDSTRGRIVYRLGSNDF